MVRGTWNQMGWTCAKLCVGWWLHACAHTVFESQLPHNFVNLLLTITNENKKLTGLCFLGRFRKSIPLQNRTPARTPFVTGVPRS